MAEAFRAVWRQRMLWALQLVGNATLMGLAWFWLSLSEASVWNLIASALIAVMVVVGALWLHGTTLAAFRRRFGLPPFLAMLRRVPALLVWAAAACGVVWLCVRYVHAPKATWVPWALAVAGVLLLLPLASAMAEEGFRALGRGASWRPLVRWEFYVGVAVLLVVGVYVPYKLIWWIPTVQGVAAQSVSLGVRFLAAYLLAITAWMVMAAMIGRGAVVGGEMRE